MTIDGVPLIGLTAPALLGIAILAIILGRLIPRWTYMEKVRECERWRQAYEVERDARATSNKQTIELLEVVKTNHTIITAIFKNLDDERRLPGEPNATPKA